MINNLSAEDKKNNKKNIENFAELLEESFTKELKKVGSLVKGKVVAIGGGAKTEDGKIIPMDVKVGDKVLFGKWSGTEVKIDGKEYNIMKESDIMGISSGK